MTSTPSSDFHDLYARIFEQSPFPCVVLDKATLKILFANASAEVYGYSRGELAKMRLSDLCILTYGLEHGPNVSASEGMWWVRYKDGRERGVLAVYQLLQPKKEGRMLVYLLEDQPAVKMSATRMARLRQLQVLVRFSSQLAAASNLPELYRAIDECIRDAFSEFYALSLWVLDQTNERFHLTYSSGHPEEGEFPQLADRSDFRSMLERKGIRIEDPRHSELFAGNRAFAEARSVTLIPLRAGAELEAVLILCSAEERHALGDADQRLMLSFGTLAGMVLHRLKLIVELRKASRLLLEAQETERQAISQDIHDEIGGLLSSLRLVLKMIPPDSSPVNKEIGEAVEIVDEVISHVRDLAFRLSPPMLKDLGLVPTLSSFTKRFAKRSRIAVTLHNEIDPDSRYEKETESTAYRIVQESLTNASKHSGASNIQVHARDEGASILIHVIDDGRGFEPAEVVKASSGMGLRGLRERVELVGGNLEIASSPGGGTRISSILPKARRE